MLRLLLLTFLLASTSGRSCSWVTVDTFCGRAEELAEAGAAQQAVVRLRGEAVRWEEQADGSSYAPVFQVRILESEAGPFRAGEVIYLWSGDGWDCNGPIDYLEPGVEYLVGFPAVPTNRTSVTQLPPNTPEDLYTLWGFGGLVYRIIHQNGQDVVHPVEFDGKPVPVNRLLAHIAPCHDGIDADLALYPNPATEWVQATFPEQRVMGLEVFDGRGRLVVTGDAGTGPTTLLRLDVRSWPSGMYYLTLRLEDGLYRRRFLVH
ncbi:T9SS type A sorting domain-containing protein [Lewinella sp. IMCC34183]|uniref:T9SS type A sorting domain-containing protein n=1 Tax=Lewinella sp. IMCC34183 TaxID=2248762 RepID=UPI0013009960|nr:T9SS type A sorting domain-containing protein [Lewinella sp. IMCC34183]